MLINGFVNSAMIKRNSIAVGKINSGKMIDAYRIPIFWDVCLFDDSIIVIGTFLTIMVHAQPTLQRDVNNCMTQTLDNVVEFFCYTVNPKCFCSLFVNTNTNDY